MLEGRSIENFYRIGMVYEKDILREYRRKYAGFVFSAHWIAHYKKAFPAFLNELREEYFIDPMNFVFGRDPGILKKNGKTKESYSKLKKEYGGVLNNLDDNSSLTPDDFKSRGEWDISEIEEFSKSVIEFQLKFSRIPEEIERYSRLTKKDLGILVNPPIFLVSPYFYSDRYNDDWYQLSLLLAKASKRLFPQTVFPVICVPKALLRENMKEIIDDYSEFDGFLFWIPDFDELEENEENLFMMIQFVSELAKMEKPIYSLYGGYFFGLLSKFGLTGFSCGICYGEHKWIDSIYKKGGFMIRYYIPFLKIKVTEIKARKFFSDNPKLLCNCEICSRLKVNLRRDLGEIESEFEAKDVFIDEFFKALRHSYSSKKHFIINRDEELFNVENRNIEAIKDILSNRLDELKKIEKRYEKELKISHLENWLNAIRLVGAI